MMAAYKEKEDLIAIGAYQHGADPLTDLAIAKRDPINDFLRQSVADASTAEEADALLMQLGEVADTQHPTPDTWRRGAARADRARSQRDSAPPFGRLAAD